MVSLEITKLRPLEKRATILLAAVMALRMFGLFLVLPVLALHMMDFQGATPHLLGWVIGAYGLTQACLQIPMGMLSDKWGRRPLILVGLALFALGSFIAMQADSISGLIVGRAIQGAGAVGAVILAAIADLTRDVVRTKAMTIVGIAIGLSFSVALFLGPVLDARIGLSGLFALTAVGALLAMAGLWVGLPRTQSMSQARQVRLHHLSDVFEHRALLALNFSIFSLHAVFSATFLFIPQTIADISGFSAAQMWRVYLPVLGVALLAMGPFMRIAHQTALVKRLMLIAVPVMALAIVALGYCQHHATLLMMLMLFFTAFNILEATLPSLVSRFAPFAFKGTALGVYSTAQFLGIFVGGVVGGWLETYFFVPGLIWGTVVLLLIWWLVLWVLPAPPRLVDHRVSFGALSSDKQSQLLGEISQLTGIVEAMLVEEARSIHIKMQAEDNIIAPLHRLEQKWRTQWPEASIKLS